MAPIREYKNWNVRKSDFEEKIDLYKRYYVLCEGQNTEMFYFGRICNNRKLLGISPEVEIIPLEKTGEDRSSSDPKKLIELADRFIEEKADEFDSKLDKIIIVFDLDIYEDNQSEYKKIIKSANEKDYLIAVTNPSFELFLMLHKKDSLQNTIRPNEVEIIKNEWVQTQDGGRKRYIDNLFNETYGINPKSDKAVGDFAYDLKTAISQEKMINQDYLNSQGVLTSNIGATMDNIMKNK